MNKKAALAIVILVAASAAHSADVALPAEIHSVAGECEGRIALAMTGGDPRKTNSLVYDCKGKRFVSLPAGGPYPGERIMNLTLTPGGFYFHRGVSVDRVAHGGWHFYDYNGKLQRVLERKDLDGHDVLIEDRSVTYMKYVPRRDTASCSQVTPVDLELVQENLEGRALWSWTSRGRIDVASWSGDTSPGQVPELRGAEDGWKRLLRPLRNCYTSWLLKVADVKTPSLFLGQGTAPLIQLSQVDFVHANSLQRLPSGDILVSARDLDAVFIVDTKQGGDIKWCLGGKHSKFCARRPVGDSRDGFSHQHAAQIHEGILWIFDNANHYRAPSRAVGYELSSDMKTATLKHEFLEPNGIQRGVFGYVQPLPGELLLVGWGGSEAMSWRGTENEKVIRPERAVSIFDLKTKREVFQIVSVPGYNSYRARWAPP